MDTKANMIERIRLWMFNKIISFAYWICPYSNTIHFHQAPPDGANVQIIVNGIEYESSDYTRY